jgi:hypothetical protein
MEEIARQGFSEMEGWGTSSPITVSFNRGLTGDPTKAAINLEDVRSRMQGDGHDFGNDPIYVVNLKTGVPMIMDAGEGYYPATLRDPWRYWPNDPKASESNLLFETVEEGFGLEAGVEDGEGRHDHRCAERGPQRDGSWPALRRVIEEGGDTGGDAEVVEGEMGAGRTGGQRHGRERLSRSGAAGDRGGLFVRPALEEEADLEADAS